MFSPVKLEAETTSACSCWTVDVGQSVTSLCGQPAVFTLAAKAKETVWILFGLMTEYKSFVHVDSDETLEENKEQEEMSKNSVWWIGKLAYIFTQPFPCLLTVYFSKVHVIVLYSTHNSLRESKEWRCNPLLTASHHVWVVSHVWLSLIKTKHTLLTVGNLKVMSGFSFSREQRTVLKSRNEP